jgi:hypothetical protein
MLLTVRRLRRLKRTLQTPQAEAYAYTFDIVRADYEPAKEGKTLADGKKH